MHTPPATPRPPHPQYRWELLTLLFWAFFLHQGDRAIFGAVLPAIKGDLGLSDTELGLVGSTLFFTLAVLMPLTGYLGDIWSRKWIITVSVTFWSLATMLTGLARGLTGLIAFRSVATAGGESFYAPAAYSLLAQFHQRTRSFAMSVHQAAVYLGVMSSGFLGGWIAEQWSWRYTFYVYGACGVLLGAVLTFRLKNSPPPDSGTLDISHNTIGPRAALAVLFRTPTAVLLTVGFTAIVFVNNAYVVWAATFVKDKYDLSLTTAAGYAMLYHHLAALAGILLGGRLSDILVARRRQFRLELQTAAMFLGVPALVFMGLAGSPTATWIGMGAVGLCRGLYECNTHASLFDVIAPRHRASAVAMMNMAAFLVGSTAPWLLGCCTTLFAEGRGLSYGFAALATAYFLGGVAVLAALRYTFPGDVRLEETVGAEDALSER